MKHIMLSLAFCLISFTANAQIVQDNLFGDNVVQQNVIQRPAHRVIRKTVRSGGVVNNNTYIVNEAPAVVAPPVSTTVTTTIIQRPPIVRYVYPTPGYYYPPGSFY
jgi:hypothetical protein